MDPRYRIKRKIDAGGMATVYLAEDQTLGRDVALKMIHPHLLDRPDALKRFENEAHTIASLSHENIVKLFDYGKSDDQRYLVMEFVDGETLLGLLGRARLFPNLALLELFQQIFSGLAAAHEKGVLHRDVKPSNIMVDCHGTVKIMDFGIASMLSTESLTITGTFVGSPNYVSPEQGGGGKASRKSDVFAAGAVFYECAAGVPAFAGENPHAVIYSIIHANPEPPVDRNPRLLRETSDLILRCLSKSPADRPEAAACFGEIENICRAGHLTLGKSRLVRWLQDQPEYEEGEGRELLEHFREKARAEFRRKRVVACLKSYSCAERFGKLPSEDRRLIDRIGMGLRMRRRVRAAAVVGGAIAALWGAWTLAPALADSARNLLRISAFAPAGSLPVSVPAPELSAALPAPPETVLTKKEYLSAAPTRTRPARAGAPPVPAAAKTPATQETAQGFLALKTNPPYAEVRIDGIKMGFTPIAEPIPLAPSRHALTLQKENFSSLDTSFSLSAGDTILLEIVLKRPVTPADGPR